MTSLFKEEKAANPVFASHVLDTQTLESYLSDEAFEEYESVLQGRSEISRSCADEIAEAMRKWAQSFGATHYCHWFQPWTGASAEKHDSFLSIDKTGAVIESFSGSALLQGEPDASSLPSGGLRNTYEARGYTCWDPSSPPFIWQSSTARVLCIPSVFFSYNGEALDTKIPLHRSDRKIASAVHRLNSVLRENETQVFSTLGCEQEYFLIDQLHTKERKDLNLLGATVQGAPPAKGQELEDHYFGALKGRVLAFMDDFERQALELGVPVKTRHNEVAPSQHEMAPLFERVSLAVDHNILLMQLMKKVADEHGLSCLLHEKPFAGINGSGKHLNWSLGTDGGENLLDPSDAGNNIRFLLLLAAVLQGVKKHADLLRASIGSYSNDKRLGGHEAPPGIISVFLGAALDALVEELIESGTSTERSDEMLNTGIPMIPQLVKHDTDRNRTSPFAFTGNKFEFRACGSSQSPAFPMAVLNVIVAEAVHELAEAIEEGKDAKEVLIESLKASSSIRFLGDNYSNEWRDIAKERGLSEITSSKEAFKALLSKSTINTFAGVLSKEELTSVYEVLIDAYDKRSEIERKLLIELAEGQILPAAFQYQEALARSIKLAEEVGGEVLPEQKRMLRRYTAAVSKTLTELDKVKQKDSPELETLREMLDTLEMATDAHLWPLPKYDELLFDV